MAEIFLPQICAPFQRHQMEIYADTKAYKILSLLKYPLLKEANTQDFGREFLGYGCSIKIVSDMTEALAHIAEHSSRHSEAICTNNKSVADIFLSQVDAAAVYHNASTRFTDGEVFGLGAEIGISTQKLHARGPFALEKLVTEKWIVRGDGQIR